MIILIAGASHTGKTLLASRLIEKYVYQGRVYSCLSLDLLKMGLIRSGNTALTPYDDEKLTPYLWSIAREIIRTALENNQNLIVEGCYIPFDFMNDFTADQREEIKYIPSNAFCSCISCCTASSTTFSPRARTTRSYLSETSCNCCFS